MDVLRIILLLSTILLTGSLSAEENSYWQFDSDNDGITIYTREHTDGLVEIRAQMFTPTTYSAFLTLLEDSENVPNWIDNASHSRVLRQISISENIVYTSLKYTLASERPRYGYLLEVLGRRLWFHYRN